jgi:hypothetical protein
MKYLSKFNQGSKRPTENKILLKQIVNTNKWKDIPYLGPESLNIDVIAKTLRLLEENIR